MNRALGFLAGCSLLLAACASTQAPQDLVARAIEASGGAESLAKVKTLSLRGTIRQWEPEQSFAPGGEIRHANDGSFAAVVDYSQHIGRIDWEKAFRYPAPRTFKYSEIVMPGAGFVLGQEANGLNRQASAQKPPAHSISSVRLTATQREWRRISPLLLLEMRDNPDRLRAASAMAVAGVSHPAVDYNLGAYTLTVLFDPITGLPARIRTLDYDNIWGDVTYDLVLSDWKTVAGLRLPTHRQYELNGRVVEDVRITDVAVNAPIPVGHFEPPAAIKAGAATPATGNVAYQWILRRQFIGTYLDSEHSSFDSRAGSGLRLNELAPGVQHQVGGTHNSLIVEMRDYLIVFDAPISDGQSNWTINAARAKYPGKPIRYVVLTHHHMDHAGGIRAFAAQGATLVVGKGSAQHFRKVLAAPFTRNPDLPSQDLTGTRIVEVADRYILSDGTREVSAHLTENPHAAAYLLGYVADARIGYVTDIWSPGAPLPGKMNPALQAVVETVKRSGIQPVTFAGGHGSTAPYATLSALAAQ